MSETVTPPSVRPQDGAVLRPGARPDSPAPQNDSPEPLPQATAPAVNATLAQLVQDSETWRRRAEQATRAAAEALQARNAHD